LGSFGIFRCRIRHFPGGFVVGAGISELLVESWRWREISTLMSDDSAPWMRTDAPYTGFPRQHDEWAGEPVASSIARRSLFYVRR
jgi:hypothetical protein